MSGSTLTMAPAVESTGSSSFHRSHSTPDLLLLSPSLPSQPDPRASFHRHTTSTLTTVSSTSAFDFSSPSPTSPTAASTSKSLPSLPAFDVPSFDFDLDQSLDFSLQNKKTSRKAEPPGEPHRRVWEDFINENTQAVTDTGSGAGAGAGAGAEVGAASGVESGVALGQNTGTADGNTLTIGPSIGSDRSNTSSPRPFSPFTSSRDERSRKSDLAVDVERPSRRRALIDRPRLWIRTSRSTSNVRELFLQEHQKDARQAVAAAIEADRYGEPADTAPFSSVEKAAIASVTENMVERPRTVSASFADFAKRSWISRSPSPRPATPPPRKTSGKKDDSREDSGRFTARLTRKRATSTVRAVDNNGSNSDTSNTAQPDSTARRRSHSYSVGSIGSGGSVDSGDRTIRPTSGTAGSSGAVAAASTAAAAAATSSAPRPFSRASEYLTRIKQRPQSVFLRSGSNTAITTINATSCNNTTAAPQVECDNDDRKAEDDSDGTAVPNTPTPTASAPTLSLDLLSVDGATAAQRDSLQTADSSRTSSSDDRSATGSAALPASEAESLTTADTSNHNSSMTHQTSRDPLWVAFKDLEANFFKFLSKTTTPQRMILIRGNLLPFLRRYALDSSNTNSKLLTPEDVERRTSILSHWWTSLLEMLDSPSQFQSGEQGSQGSNTLEPSSRIGTYFPTSTTTSGHFQPISGVDRPALLEAVSMIMSRPEWRLLTKFFRPLAERSPSERVRARANTSDAPPLEDSGFLLEESAEHNVRTTFINNLMAQMVLVVDKMSLRNAPLSMVSFSGKACAYAFFFVPGVADILVRLWGLDKNAELIRRAADAFGLPRRSRGESSDLVALFPPCVGPLGWSSVSSMQAKLRRPPKMNLLLSTSAACSRMPWFAPCWLSRWRGASTDLLFIFCKYYHVLANEFMPPSLELPLVEKARAPAYVLLHAQLLHILDDTIHRQAAMEAAMMMGGPPMGDGGSTSANASLLPLMWQPSHNLFRDMDENRIIALLRDLLASDASLIGARDTFARSLMVLLKAAACRTSQYDHSACYMLCDFLHEVLLAFDSYYDYCNSGNVIGTPPAVDYIDWNFWLDVCKMMMESNNTMSEIRVMSFIFSTWDIVTADLNRKEELCMRWLLTEDVFDKFFNNWCPMVRAYYMRLLCWRMCRDYGSSNELDAKIFLLVSQRLKKVWSHYLWLKTKADKEGILPPSTAPSLPQPGKRFMIVRTEVTVPQPGLLANGSNSADSIASSFDALSTAIGDVSGSTTDYRGTTNAPGAKPSFSPSADEKKTDGSAAKKKWSLLGKVLSFTASVSSPPRAEKQSSDEQLEQMRRDTAVARSSSPLPPSKTKRLGSPSSDSGSSTGSAPVFDSAHFVFKFMLHNIPWQGAGGGLVGANGGILLPPVYRDRILTRPRLPAPAQARVSSRLSSLGRRPESPPPPAAGLPAATRRVSGAAMGGLISEARNANPAESVPDDDRVDKVDRVDGSVHLSGDVRMSSSFDAGSRRSSFGIRPDSPGVSPMDGPPALSSFEWEREREQGSRPVSRAGSPDDDFEQERVRERMIVQPMEPKGEAMRRAKYAGRALAEWSMVVNECNSFVDRRRDEGVFGLKDVEIPSLGVEGLRHIG